MANVRKRHNKFFKYLTIGAATLGMVSSASFAVIMGIHAADEDFIVDDLREYTATFSNEGSVIVSTQYKRGEAVVPPENPSHSVDGQGTYLFIGWDLTGNGVPDLLPTQMYFSFNAEAVYFKIGEFDLSWLDISNMDLEQLLELMEMLNIDWEQFMDMFGIDLEQLMELLNKPVITFEADTSQYITYFRATSFGDFNYASKKYANPSFYDSKKIRSGSINPLSYTADKLNTAYNLVGTLPESFSFVNYDITFLAPSEYYAVPDCEHSDSTNDIVDSDAHFVKVPEDLRYQTRAAYVPALSTSIEALGMVPYSNNNITKDEKDYYNYALEHYTSIPSEYEGRIDSIIREKGWQPDDVSQVENIGAYVEELGRCSLFNEEGDLDLGYKKNDDPVEGLIQNEAGSDFDFNTVAMMIFRRLDIPARMVKGYVVPQVHEGTNTISFLNQHWWCEIYVKKIGWMICDCMNAENFLGMNPYGDMDKKNTPFEEKHILESIDVYEPSNTTYDVGDSFNPIGGYIIAHFKDGDERIPLGGQGVTVEGFDSSTPGTRTITVSYTHNGITKSDTFEVEIIERDTSLERVEFDFSAVKDWYYEGQDFDIDHVVAIAYYADGTDKIISPADLTVSGFVSEPGNYTVTVSYDKEEAKDVEFDLRSDVMNVIVYKKRVEDISIDSLPIKTDYYVGEDFDPTGLAVSFEYYDGESGEGKGYSISEPDMSTPGNKTIEISYVNEKDGDVITKTFTISVLENMATSLVVNSYKDNYIVTEPFDPGAFLISIDAYATFKYTADEQLDATQMYIIDYPNLAETGTTYCRIGYTDDNGHEVEAVLPITVTSLGGAFELTYPNNYFDVDYNGASHQGSISYDLVYPDNFPSFLTAKIDFVSTNPDNGADVDEHTYTPVLRILNGGVDVTDKFGYYLNSGLSGVTYYVNPIALDITVGPAEGTYHVNDIIPIECNCTGLVNGDYAVFVGTVSYSYVGTYSNYLDYGQVVIYNKNGEDVTGCYYIANYNATTVKVTD